MAYSCLLNFIPGNQIRRLKYLNQCLPKMLQHFLVRSKLNTSTNVHQQMTNPYFDTTDLHTLKLPDNSFFKFARSSSTEELSSNANCQKKGENKVHQSSRKQKDKNYGAHWQYSIFTCRMVYGGVPKWVEHFTQFRGNKRATSLTASTTWLKPPIAITNAPFFRGIIFSFMWLCKYFFQVYVFI